MKIRLRWATALIACVSLVCTTSAQAQRQRNYRAANNAAEMAGASLASYNSFDNSFDDSYGTDLGECNSCEDGSYIGEYSGGRSGILGRPGQFFVAADYLNVRATFSESTAYVVRTGTAPPAGNTLLPPITNVFQELDYGYQSSYRIFGGYRFNECGGEIRFAFTRFDSSASALSPPAVPAAPGGQTTQILNPFDLVATSTGDRISVNSNVGANIYDLGFAKTIPLGSPACGGCDSCASACDTGCDTGCGWCPAWDLRWSAGIRFAEVNWDRRAELQSTNDYGSTTMDFDGGGARVGLEGTRYLGRQQRFAIFARGDMSILLGEVSIEHTSGVGGTAPSILNLTQFSSTQLIPVLDIEAGGTFYVTDRLTVSAGYLLSAWFDLGMRDTFDVLEGAGPISFDDSNILGFDGFFVRSEFAF
ncbi:MAG: hypothetical protein GXP26_13455 [Planctomycetes bacterium]|nr:hypothetical protein [Planctomycetota bacterium]